MNYAEWPLSAPINLTWEITHKCNLRCIHCLSDSRDELFNELSLDECKMVVDQLAALRVFEINFGGGEPFLKDHFLSLVDYINTKGIVTCISTNGTLLSREVINFLDKNPLIYVQVSLDGAGREINDVIRGKGTFLRIMEGIELLASRKIRFSINTVITSINYTNLNELKALASFYNANLRVSRFRPSGRAKHSWDKLKLNIEQLEGLSDWLGKNPDIMTGDSFFSISNKSRKGLGLDMCGACKMTCCIDPSGAVYPCAFMQTKDFCGGNITQTGFKEIWDSSPIFLKFRHLKPDSCVKCPRFNTCRGGCPAVAYFIKGDLNSSDPECLVSWVEDRAVMA